MFKKKLLTLSLGLLLCGIVSGRPVLLPSSRTTRNWLPISGTRSSTSITQPLLTN